MTGTLLYWSKINSSLQSIYDEYLVHAGWKLLNHSDFTAMFSHSLSIIPAVNKP